MGILFDYLLYLAKYLTINALVLFLAQILSLGRESERLMVFIPSHDILQGLDSNQITSALTCHHNAIAGILALHKSKPNQESNSKTLSFSSLSTNASLSRDVIHTGPSSIVLASLYKYHLSQARLLEEMLALSASASSTTPAPTRTAATLAQDLPDELDTIGELPTNAGQRLLYGPDTFLAPPTSAANASLALAGSALARRQLPPSDLERLRLLRELEELSTLKQSHLAQVRFSTTSLIC